MSRLKIKPEAMRDIDEIVAYLAEHSVGTATRFYSAITESCEFLEMHPHVGRRWFSRLHSWVEMRSYGVLGFRNYRIFFLVQADTEILVVRVLHAARDSDALIGDPD